MDHSTIYREKLEEILDHIKDAYAPNTIRAYRADFSEWINYCKERGARPLPADPFDVAKFLIELCDGGEVKSSTIRRKCASISAIHRYAYMEDPTKHPEVKIATRKVNRRLGTRFKQALPINRHTLEQMLDACGEDLRGARNRMILLLAYNTLRRRSELTSLRVEDFAIGLDGASHIMLCQSKTDQTREGVVLRLDHETTLAISDWLGLANISDGYLLRGIVGSRINEHMDPGQINRVFKSLTLKAGLDPMQISGHSTRIGAAQDMMSGGASIAQIMAKVGWTKVDTVMRYVGVGDIAALNSTGRRS